jgi:hypothetical protein
MKIIIRSKKSNWYFLIKALIKIIDSVVPIITLGFFWTNLEYEYTKKCMFKNCETK